MNPKLTRRRLISRVIAPGAAATKTSFWYSWYSASIASAMKVSGDMIEDVRMAAGAVECVADRLNGIGQAWSGRQRSGQTDLAIRGAVPLSYNNFKVPLMANLVKRAVPGAA